MTHLGKLIFQPAQISMALLGETVNNYLFKNGYEDVQVAEIDSNLADTAAFCEQYDIGMDVSANCVIVEAKRGETVKYAACVILATTRVSYS